MSWGDWQFREYCDKARKDINKKLLKLSSGVDDSVVRKETIKYMKRKWDYVRQHANVSFDDFLIEMNMYLD